MALWLRDPRNAPGWFARLRRDGTSTMTDSRFRRWLARDPRNEVRYEQQELVWTVAGELEHDQDIKALLADIETTPQTPAARPVQRSHPLLAAAACGLALLTIGWVILTRYEGNLEQRYATHIGEERTILLPDRSTMTLNTATRVRVSYGRSYRTVILEQGEATLSVTPDAARAFEVTAAGGTARALGTQFNVLAAGNRITVAVLEGRVAVSTASTTGPKNPAGTALVLTGGEQVTYAGAQLDRPEPANLARIRGWHAGRIVLNNVQLDEAVAEFNRYSALPLRVGNPALLTHRITGVFRTGETSAFLDALQEAFDVHIERTSTAITLR